ncbi:MAG: T9SS type A sorting domain-containing protein [Bacteroidales bacterium]|nr:T9SS type A sorting domain-containing protein [Bacteroidales bacterium]
MKKALLFFVVILMSLSVFAQTKATFVLEHFNGSSLPSGWQAASGTGSTNWSISATENAGGTANELMLNWSPQFNGTTRMMMPTFDLTGVESIVVKFKHALDNYSGSHTIGIATSSDGGSTWHVGWQQNYNASNHWTVSQTITTEDMGNSAVRFCLFYTGNSYNINYWYFDDFEIFTQENLDVQLTSVDVNNVIGAGNRNVVCTIENKGLTTVNQVRLLYQLNSLQTVEQVFDVNLASLASTQLTFAEPMSLVPGDYNLTVTVMAVNGVEDDDPDNNSLDKSFTATLGSAQKIAMIEHFSSSTCGPCVQPNILMQTVTNNNPGKFTYTKYQMNWPGSGDPYYTAEGGTRRQYYGVSAVPMIFIDAQQKSAGQAQATINSIYNTPAFTDVRGSFNVEGSIVTAKVDFMSYYDLSNAKVFVSVNEKETKNNVGSNGETSFHHIFMKFLTSATGNDVNIEAGGYQHFEFTQDMTGTHVEDMADLEVSAWIQIYGTKEMLNSHFLYEYTDIHPYPVQNLEVTLQDETITATWEAPEGGNAYAYNVYINGELAETVTDLEYTTTTTSIFNAVAVEALYSDEKTSVRIVKSVTLPYTELTLNTTNIVFYDMDEVKTLMITNNTTDDVTINEIATVGSDYAPIALEISETLPFVLTPGSTMDVNITYVGYDREIVTTDVDIVSSLGTQTVSVTYDNTFGIADNVVNSYEIYPNPTNGNIMVKGENINLVEVYNLCGQKVLSVNGSADVDVNMSSLSSGVYMVKVIDVNGNSSVNKVIKR